MTILRYFEKMRTLNPEMDAKGNSKYILKILSFIVRQSLQKIVFFNNKFKS
jgi:hypothetical protein